jgi:hypothetical protein
MENKSGSESRIRMRDEHPMIPDHFPESLEKVFWVKKYFNSPADPDLGSGIFLTLDPGWKNSDPGSRINFPDPQH